jgi:hypothetical protein
VIVKAYVFDSPSVALAGGLVKATLGTSFAGTEPAQFTRTWNLGLPAVEEPSPAA